MRVFSAGVNQQMVSCVIKAKSLKNHYRLRTVKYAESILYIALAPDFRSTKCSEITPQFCSSAARCPFFFIYTTFSLSHIIFSRAPLTHAFLRSRRRVLIRAYVSRRTYNCDGVQIPWHTRYPANHWNWVSPYICFFQSNIYTHP